MTKNDRYVIISNLIKHNSYLEYDIAHNKTYTEPEKRHRISENEQIIFDVINRLIEETEHPPE